MDEKNTVQWFQLQILQLNLNIYASLYSAIALAKARNESSAAWAQVGLVSVS